MKIEQVNADIAVLLDQCASADFKFKVTYHEEDVIHPSLERYLKGLKPAHLPNTKIRYFEATYFSNLKDANYSINYYFAIDITAMQILLRARDSKINFDNKTHIESFAEVISKPSNKFDFKNWLACHNKIGDKNEEIADYIIEKTGAINGGLYGL
jgi:hypothetical protein